MTQNNTSAQFDRVLWFTIATILTYFFGNVIEIFGRNDLAPNLQIP